jgi:hypothetical protein
MITDYQTMTALFFALASLIFFVPGLPGVLYAEMRVARRGGAVVYRGMQAQVLGIGFVSAALIYATFAVMILAEMVFVPTSLAFTLLGLGMLFVLGAYVIVPLTVKRRKQPAAVRTSSPETIKQR